MRPLLGLGIMASQRVSCPLCREIHHRARYSIGDCIVPCVHLPCPNCPRYSFGWFFPNPLLRITKRPSGHTLVQVCLYHLHFYLCIRGQSTHTRGMTNNPIRSIFRDGPANRLPSLILHLVSVRDCRPFDTLDGGIKPEFLLVRKNCKEQKSDKGFWFLRDNEQ